MMVDLDIQYVDSNSCFCILIKLTEAKSNLHDTFKPITSLKNEDLLCLPFPPRLGHSGRGLRL